MVSKHIVGIAVSLILLLFGATGVDAQEVNVEAGFYTEDMRVVFLSDLNLTRTGTGLPIFWIRLQNTTPDARQVYLIVSFKTGEDEVLARGETKVFNLASYETRQFNNQDLISDVHDYSFRSYDWDEDVATTLKEYIEQHGKLRPGIYTLTVEVFDASSYDRYDFTVLTLDVTNPTTLDLFAPGVEVGTVNVQAGELPVIYTTWPQFFWESDIDLFRIVVAEKPPDILVPEDATPEQILDYLVRLDKYVRVYRGTGPLPASSSPDTIVTYATFLQYPGSGVLPLENGRTYFWQITGIVPTSGTTLNIESEVWGFQIADLGEQPLGPGQLQILSQLRDLLGDELVELLFGPGGLLEGFDPTGVVLDSRGQQMTQEQLVALISLLLSGHYEFDYEVLDQ